MRQLSRAAAAIALIVVFAGAVSAAPTLNVNDELNFDPGLGSNGGGEFTANVMTGVSTGAVFKTFCIERTQRLNFDDNFIIGAITTAGLDSGTAYLFSKFHNGNLANYSSASGADQTSLQLAIWFLQGQLGFSPDLNATYLADAKASTFVASAAGAVGTYGVRILKMQNLSGGDAQDVLIVPEPASILAWSLIGGCFVAGHRIRRNKRALV